MDILEFQTLKESLSSINHDTSSVCSHHYVFEASKYGLFGVMLL